MGSQSPPLRKKRKRSSVINDMPDIKDDNILDLTTNSNNDNRNNKVSKKGGRKKYSSGNKISYLGAGAVIKPDGKWVGLMVIRNEVFEFVNNDENVIGLIEMMKVDLKRRALGADIGYKQVLNKNNKLVMVKQEYLSDLNYANDVQASGGGGTGYTKIENIVLVDGACPIVAKYWKLLKCNPAHEPQASGNIGKIHKVWVYLVLILEYGSKYASMVHKRSCDSIRKRITLFMTKKKTDADSIRVRSIFAKWGGPKNVVQTSYVHVFICLSSVCNLFVTNHHIYTGIDCIKKSTRPAALPSVQAKAQSLPCLPLQPRKQPIAKQVHQKAMIVLNDLHQKILSDKDENKMEYSKDDILSIPNIVATPPIAPSTTAPPNNDGFMNTELLFYSFISDIYKMENENGITDQIKESTVSSLMKAWHNKSDQDNKEHISNLMIFITKQSGLSNAGKLRMIRIDLNEFLK